MSKTAAKIKKNRARVILKCAVCSKEFAVTRGEINSRQPKYCSPECFQKVRLNSDVIEKIRDSVNKHYEEHPETKVALRKARLKQTFPAKDTTIEIALQEELVRRGIVYDKHLPVLGLCQPDIVFPQQKIAVFADGDYWHTKDEKVRQKDKFQNSILKANGWVVLRFWEHEIRQDVSSCVDQIAEVIKALVVEKAT